MTRTAVTILALLFACLLRAEPPHSQPPGPPFLQLAEVLELTDAQLAPVRAILQAQHAQRRALHQAVRDQHEALRQSTHARLAALLSAAQMQKLRAFEEAHRPPAPREGEGRPAPCDHDAGSCPARGSRAAPTRP